MRRGPLLAALALLLAPFALVFVLAIFVSTSSGSASCPAPEGAPANASAKASEEIPHNLLPIYVGAAERYKLGATGWAWLASINEQETDFGRDLQTSSAGAAGWMQFMPETWAKYGVTPSGAKAPDGPEGWNDPADAIYSAANYLHASGAPGDWSGAVYAYNHATWYVAQVAARAASYLAEPQLISAAAGRGAVEDVSKTSVSTAGAEATQASAAGVTISGRASVIDGPGQTIELRDAATVGGSWQVSFPDGRSVRITQSAVGPPERKGGPVMVVSSATLRAAGYASAAQLGAGVVVATYVPGGGEDAASCGGEGTGASPVVAVARLQAAANALAALKVPYVYGGGHMTPAVPDPGLDCSSSISWVFQHAGYRIETMVSGAFAAWGQPGVGRYVTIYANAGHVFMAIRSTPSAPWRYF
ncbi:MAG: lytic transglycosylase domain-containing protein, partial [Solirubrobacteraceae bacterium]